MSRALLVLLGASLLPGCSVLPEVDFERMISQSKSSVWQSSPYFADGRAIILGIGAKPEPHRRGDVAEEIDAVEDDTPGNDDHRQRGRDPIDDADDIAAAAIEMREGDGQAHVAETIAR